MIHCVSFGFKYGIPSEADLVFDVRCLPNPYYVEELKHLTGLDEPVSPLCAGMGTDQGGCETLYRSNRLYDSPLLQRGKKSAGYCCGLHGWQTPFCHVAQLLYDHLQEKKMRVSVNHRDIKKL